MFSRKVLLVGVVGVAIIGILWWQGLLHAPAHDAAKDGYGDGVKAGTTVDIGKPLYGNGPGPAAPLPTVPPNGVTADPIVIGDCRLAVIDKQEVPSQRNGVLLFVGTE